MLYARINRETKAVVEFPVSEVQLRARLSNTTLPEKITAFHLLGTEYAQVDAGTTELRPTISARVASVGATYNEETGEYDRQYGLVSVPEAQRENRVMARWAYLRKRRLNTFEQVDRMILKNLSQERQGIRPTIRIGVIDAFAQKLRDMTTDYTDPYDINEQEFFKVPVPE